MGNTCFFYSSSHLSDSYSPSYNFAPRIYQVFISHRGEDTKQNTASHLYYNLKQKGYTAFLDKNSIRGGELITKSIEHAIRSALVHVVILSPRFAESEWCLEELRLMLNTRAPIVPVFWGISPSVVSMEEKGGAYARAFQVHKKTGRFNAYTLKKWKRALRKVSDIKGINYDGDQGEKLEQIAESVVELIEQNANPS